MSQTYNKVDLCDWCSRYTLCRWLYKGDRPELSLCQTCEERVKYLIKCDPDCDYCAGESLTEQQMDMHP